MSPEFGNTPSEQHVNPFKRFINRILGRTVTPKLIEPDSLEFTHDGAEPVIEATQEYTAFTEGSSAEDLSPLITVTLDEEGIFYLDKEESGQIGPFVTRYDSSKLLRELAAMYITTGPGAHSAEDIAARSNYKPSTVLQSAGRLASVLPKEIISLFGDTNENIRFGHLALASSLKAETAHGLAKENLRIQTPEQINEGKTDLTTQAYAIFATKGASEQAFYLPLQSTSAILATRVVEAIRDLRPAGVVKNVQSSRIAERAWHNMTTAERQIFVDEEEWTLRADTSVVIELPVMKILRKLTNKLMLTHEPYSDRFTLLDTGLEILHIDQSIGEKQACTFDRLRPITVPEQMMPEELTQESQTELKNLAREYILRAKSYQGADDDFYIRMIDFIMSPEGHWAVNAVAGKKGMFKTHDGAMHAMHTYLRVNFKGYGPAYRSRLIGGNRRVQKSGQKRARQVGGVLPNNSNWTLGHGVQELFGEIMVKPGQ